MKLTDPSLAQMGMWVTMCCHLELHQLRAEQELGDVREYIEGWVEGGGGPMPYYGWATEEEALLELRKRWDDVEVRSEIDDRLAKL